MGNDISAKVAGSSSGAALGTLIVWILGQFNVTVAPDVAAALATVLAALGGFLVRDVARDRGNGIDRMPVEEPNKTTPPAA